MALFLIQFLFDLKREIFIEVIRDGTNIGTKVAGYVAV